MSRARNLKPLFFKNEELADLPFEYRLLFQGLWCLADREGRLENRPKRIKAEIFPYDAVDVEAGLAALAKSGFITIYEVDGLSLIAVVAFLKHQNPHCKEAASTLPAPCAHGASNGKRSKSSGARTSKAEAASGASPALTLNPQPDSLNRIPESLESPEPQAASEPPVMTFPVVGTDDGSREWPLMQATVDEFAEAFPGVDVAAECRKARVWCLANPTKQKTPRGMPNFLRGWLERVQNRGGTRAGPAPAARAGRDLTAGHKELMQRMAAANERRGADRVVQQPDDDTRPRDGQRLLG